MSATVSRVQSPIVRDLRQAHELMSTISQPLARAIKLNAVCKENIRLMHALAGKYSSEKVSSTIQESIATINNVQQLYAKSIAIQAEMAKIHAACSQQLVHLKAGVQGNISAGDANATLRIEALERAVKIMHLFHSNLYKQNELLKDRVTTCKADLTPLASTSLFFYAIPAEERSYLSTASWELQYLHLHPNQQWLDFSSVEAPIDLNIPAPFQNHLEIVDPALTNIEELEQLSEATAEFESLSPQMPISLSASSTNPYLTPSSSSSVPVESAATSSYSTQNAATSDDDDYKFQSPAATAPSEASLVSSSGSSSYATVTSATSSSTQASSSTFPQTPAHKALSRNNFPPLPPAPNASGKKKQDPNA